MRWLALLSALLAASPTAPAKPSAIDGVVCLRFGDGTTTCSDLRLFLDELEAQRAYQCQRQMVQQRLQERLSEGLFEL